MKRRSKRPRIALGALALLVAISVLVVSVLGAATTGALETNDGCPNPDPIYRAHASANAPEVFYIGDSISANADQKAIYAEKNWAKGWKTIVIAQGGAKIMTHRCLNWLSFYYAHQGNARAVVVELGTNDIFRINDGNAGSPPPPMPANQRLAEMSKVFTQMRWVADYLDNKCVVWVGLNHLKDSFADDKDTALSFNKKLTELASSHPRLHYASYSVLIRDNRTFYNSLFVDPGHDGVHPTFNGKWELGAWVTRQVDNFCI
jgi:lysophospholipase L1-like esterase